MSKTKGKSINLYPVGGDNDRSGSEDEEEPETPEAEELMAKNRALMEKQGMWGVGGTGRDNLIAKVIGYISKFVSYDVEQANNGHGECIISKKYTALPDAVQAAHSLKKLLLNHDNSDTRDLTILLHKYQLLQSQLLPLLGICVHDGLTSRVCLRLISQLVIPLSDNTIRTLNLAITGKKSTETRDEWLDRVEKVKKTKENACQQLSALLAFKETIVGEDTLFKSVVSTLAGPLRKPEKDRGDGENQIIETVLHILSNLATIHTTGNVVTLAEKVKAQMLHCQLIARFEGAILNIIVNFCESINTPVFKDNLNFFIDLISSLFRGFDARELFKHWKTIQSATKIATSTTDGSMVAPRKAQVTVYSNKNTVKTTVVSAGLLSAQLKAEKAGRVALLNNSTQRHPRFGGMYTLAAGSAGGKAAGGGEFSTPLPVGSKGARREAETDDSAGGDPKLRPHQLLIRNPFSSIAENLPQADKKRIKRNAPFAPDANDDGLNSLYNGVDPEGEQSTMMAHHISEETTRRTSSVIVQFLEKFTLKGFEKLVFCVKEDLRRDENRVGFGTEELEYFKITTVCLRYHRLKVMQDREHQLQADRTASQTWVPRIRPMMAALDRISYTRVISTIKRLTVVEKKFESVMVPMETYKEMICYIHLMLQSTNTAHHELAIAALYPLFYVSSSERTDPLVQLLREWKPAVYTRKHVHLLVELVHETLKTLEAAKTCFSTMSKRDDSHGGKKGASEAEIDRYIAAALRFSEVEYFERLVNPHTVKLYTVLLADHRMCSATVNHYVYCFLQRMYSHKMESDKWGVEVADQSAASPTSVTLGYLLFNIQTLDAINNMLCFSHAASGANKATSPLVRLLLCIVRSFGELANKNHLLYVEALFHGSRSMDYIFGLDTVYNAEATARGFHAAATRAATTASDGSDVESSDSSSGSEDEGASRKRRGTATDVPAPTAADDDDDDHAKEDYGDEFDEHALPESFASRGKKKSKSKRGALKRARRGRGDASAHDGSDSDAEGSGNEGKIKTVARRSIKRPKWTHEEDAVLREQYSLYQGSSSCFETIAQHESLSAYNVSQIKKRVKALTYYRASGEVGAERADPEAMAEEEGSDDGDDDASGDLPETQRDGSAVEGDEALFRNNKLRLATPYSTDGEGEEVPGPWDKDTQEDGRNWTGISSAGRAKKGLTRGSKADSGDGDSDDDNMFVEGETSVEVPVVVTTAAASAPAAAPVNMRRLAIRDDEDD